MDELWAVFCEDLGETLPPYNGTELYYNCNKRKINNTVCIFDRVHYTTRHPDEIPSRAPFTDMV